MESQTIEIGDQEVQITETEDGFEAEPVPRGPAAQFRSDTGFSETDAISTGHIDEIEGLLDDNVRVHVNDSSWDVMRDSGVLGAAADNGWRLTKIEFEQGYVQFEKE